jgi:hypothetical protein
MRKEPVTLALDQITRARRVPRHDRQRQDDRGARGRRAAARATALGALVDRKGDLARYASDVVARGRRIAIASARCAIASTSRCTRRATAEAAAAVPVVPALADDATTAGARRASRSSPPAGSAR